MVKQVPPRAEIPESYKWDLTSVFLTDEAWEDEVAQVKELLAEVPAFRNHLGDGPGILSDWLETMARLRISLGKIHVYAHGQHSVDTADQASGAKQARSIGLIAEARAATAFAEPEMLAIGIETLKEWAGNETRLAIYDHYFDEMGRRLAHVRSPEVEELLGGVTDAFRTATATHGILADADLRFEPVPPSDDQGEPIPVAQGNIGALQASPVRGIRRAAWESYADAHLALRNTLANCLAAGVKQNVFVARARRHNSALEAALFGNHIPTQVFHNVIETFCRNLPTWHRYWRVRREALGYDKLHVYDIKAPLTPHSPQIPLDQAVEWICEGLRPLGAEYVGAMRHGLLAERWVDVYPNQGKASGAFSTGAPGTRPFVLMSYTDDLYSLSTLAHELGHSMHSYYTWRTQPVVYCDYSIFVAEVASNFNQALVRDHLFQTKADPDFQIALIEEAMSNFHRYMFLMPTLARFELDIHQRVERGEALTADGMIELMTDLFREGYGGEAEIDKDRVGITWAAFHTHLYANFYVYQYTTGIAAAQALAERVLSGTPGAVDDYFAFLRAGSSLYPLDALKLAGIDLASPEPVQEAYDSLSLLVDRLALLLGQREQAEA